MSQTTWNIDTTHSSVGFWVRHLVISKVHGRFTKWSGTIVLDESDITKSAVDVTIDAASIETHEEKRDAHLRSPDFFDVEQHPEIAFESTRIEHVKKGDYRVEGELTMHGETHTVEFEVTVHGVTKDPQGQDRVGLEARGTLSRSEFGLRWQQALETGGVLVGDEVRVSADIAAVCTSPHAEGAAA